MRIQMDNDTRELPYYKHFKDNSEVLTEEKEIISVSIYF